MINAFDTVAAVCVAALLAACVLWWVREKAFYDITLDDVMKNPDKFFHNSQWDDIVATVVTEEAMDRVFEANCKNSTEFAVHVARQEGAIWAVLNQKLAESRGK